MNSPSASSAQRVDPKLAEQTTQSLQALLSRSATDNAFRQQLLTNPRAALATFSGKSVADIPESVNIKFVENTVDATIVLPNFVDPDAELSDRELETVAGGTDLLLTAIAITLAIDGGLLSYGIASGKL